LNRPAPLAAREIAELPVARPLQRSLCMKTLRALFLLLMAAGPATAAADRQAVVVTTRPSGGLIFVDGLAAGFDGDTLVGRRGSRAEVMCLLPASRGWSAGRAEVRFDGSSDTAVCRMAVRTRCVQDLKNPFRRCPG
jgi:hypothetical protein